MLAIERSSWLWPGVGCVVWMLGLGSHRNMKPLPWIALQERLRFGIRLERSTGQEVWKIFYSGCRSTRGLVEGKLFAEKMSLEFWIWIYFMRGGIGFRIRDWRFLILEWGRDVL
ncbi:hypothetical protein MCEMIH22_00821 [Candidatus Methylacidiphilaceae bacterium]